MEAVAVAPILAPVEDAWAGPDISEAELRARGIPVEVVDCATIGGGMGSFAWVDVLRNGGVPPDRIAVITDEEPGRWRYRRYVANSQMVAPRDRIRSNSESCPDNPWGFPGYALREGWGELRRGRLRAAFKPWLQVLGEPVLTQTYTPYAHDVFAAMDREGERIGWARMCRHGEAVAVRRTTEGRLVAIARGPDGAYFGVSARYMQLAVGYPAINVLPDVIRYRDQHGDRWHVVNAYEPHDHVYRALMERGGTVLLRGRGIVASRIIEKLHELRNERQDIQVIHLHRKHIERGHRLGFARRPSGDDLEFQPFNWPKGCWGGELRNAIEKGSDERRRELHEALGGTTTADRGLWRRVVREGRAGGWYRPAYGTASSLSPGGAGVVAEIQGEDGGQFTIQADFVVDCTGMTVDPSESRLLADLMSTYEVPRNGIGRIRVTNGFEVDAVRHGDARLYACGAMTLGGPFASVDTFLGLQYTAMRTAYDMHQADPASVRILNGLYSIRQWFKWARGRAP